MNEKSTGFDLSIDRYRLDEEWERQPRFYHEFAEKLVDARRSLDETKNQLEVVKADTYQHIARDPEKFGLQKTTEKAIEHAMTMDKRCREAANIVIEAKHVVGIFEAAVSALEQRKKALEKLVELHVSDYYSKPRTRKGEAQEYVEDAKRQSFQRRTSKRREHV